MTDRYDAIVIGAGHNGLVCSAMLAKAGKKVLVLEAKDQVGGAAITREFAEGYSVSACAHLLYQLQPKVRKELGLSPKLASDNMQTIALDDGRQHVRYSGDVLEGESRVPDFTEGVECRLQHGIPHTLGTTAGSPLPNTGAIRGVHL